MAKLRVEANPLCRTKNAGARTRDSLRLAQKLSPYGGLGSCAHEFPCNTKGTYPHEEAGIIGFDHIDRNPPVLIRTPKLTRSEPAQYWGGGPPGNSVVLNPFFPQHKFFLCLLSMVPVSDGDLRKKHAGI